MKKTIAKHILGIIGVGILWFIVNQGLDKWFGEWRYDRWDTDIDDDGGLLLLGMLVGYIVIHWAVKTIWFDKDKDKDSQKGD
jgi:hypothetical protein